jgi:hypothetical protein
VCEFDEIIGGVAHRRDCDDDIVAEGFRRYDSARDSRDAFSISDGRTTELLNDEGQRDSFQNWIQQKAFALPPAQPNSSGD